MSEETPNNIIRFKPREGKPDDEARPPVIRKPRDYEGCQHKYAEVDEALWRLECQECHEVLDPIRFLLTVVAVYEERDYKFTKIQEFEERERQRMERRRRK